MFEKDYNLDQNKKTMIFVSGSMSKGGAERVLSNIANYLTDYNIYILTLLRYDVAYELYDHIKVIDASKQGMYVKNIFFWIKTIRKYIKLYKPQTVLSFAGRINLLTIIANIGIKNKLVVSERNDPNHDGRSKLLVKLTNFFYLFTDKIIFQTKYAKSIFWKSVQKKSEVIANPLNPQIYLVEKKEMPIKKIVTVGRLEYQKNHKLLINAMNKLHEYYPEYILEIYGEGTLRKDIENQIKSLKAESYIFLRGQEDNIYEKIKDAELFVLSSRFEGVSNALLEAMQLGLICISSNYPGVNEIIHDKVNGYLFENGNLESFVKVLINVIGLKNKKEITNSALKTMKEYDAELILNKWKEILK